MNTVENRRILLVDDLPAIHEDFRKILAGTETDAELARDEALLFGSAPRVPTAGFVLDSALQGAEAIQKVRSAQQAGSPYAMAFVDMRMPPGCDGVETVERLWDEDPQLQVVICTAYSDYSWADVLTRLDVRDRLLILKKPFDAVEVFQLASALTRKWGLARQAALEKSRLEEAVEERTRQLSDANIIVKNSPVVLYRVSGATSLPLVYVSDNVAKFGLDRARLIANPDWADVIVHPDDRAKIDAAKARLRVENAEGGTIEFRLRTAGDTFRWAETRYRPIYADGRLAQVEGVLIDVTERKLAEERIAVLARTDALTGLANRTTFVERLLHAFSAARRGASAFAVFYLDLDHFKPVNDSLGHAAGDLLLRQVAERLSVGTRESDLVARLGGDEFALLQTEIGDIADAASLANKLIAALAVPFVLNGNEARISASIGICVYAEGSESPDSMLKQADLALYSSKREGRNQYHFHSNDLDLEIVERTKLSRELKEALEQEALEIQFQPRSELWSGAAVGVGAVVSWMHPSRGPLTEAEILAAAEQAGILPVVTRWVLRQACQQMHRWRAEGSLPPAIAVTLTLGQLKAGMPLVSDIAAAIAEWRMSPSELEFDVTEDTLAQLATARNDVVSHLHRLGVRISIDDFGSDHSTFEYVKSYGVRHLKVSSQLINVRTTDTAGSDTIRAIDHFARGVRIPIIAQNVEPNWESTQLTGYADWARLLPQPSHAPYPSTSSPPR